MATPGRYPLSTANGIPIPLDVIRPDGILPINFNSATGSTGILLPTDIEIIQVTSNEDCIIGFASSNTAVTDVVNVTLKADSIFLPANMIYHISPPVDKRYLSVIGDSTSGRLICNLLAKWSSITLQSQIDRGGR